MSTNPEANALNQAIDSSVTKTADFGHPLVEVQQNVARPMMSPEQLQAAAFVNGPVREWQNAFLRIVNAEDGHRYDGFTNYVREMANKKDADGNWEGPVYRMVLGLSLA